MFWALVSVLVGTIAFLALMALLAWHERRTIARLAEKECPACNDAYGLEVARAAFYDLKEARKQELLKSEEARVPPALSIRCQCGHVTG